MEEHSVLIVRDEQTIIHIKYKIANPSACLYYLRFVEHMYEIQMVTEIDIINPIIDTEKH